VTATGSAQVFMTPTLTARSRRVLAVVSGRQLRAETAGESHQKRGYEALAAASDHMEVVVRPGV
jgi:hypothetical protein